MKYPALTVCLALVAAGVCLLVVLLSVKDTHPPEGPVQVIEPVPVKPERVSVPEPPVSPEVAAGTIIDGTVNDADGKPMWRVTVRLKDGPYAEREKTRTNHKGMFSFRGLDPDRCYSVEASMVNHMTERIDSVDAGTRNLRFVLRRGARLTGEVLSADVGRPVDYFTVILSGAEEKSVTFDHANGHFLIEELV